MLEKINNLHEQILKGGDFSSIAKEISDSFSGKIGKIGWITEVDLDSKILNKVKKLEKNKVSVPLKGNAGYFIIKVINKRIIGAEEINQVSLFKFQLIDVHNQYEILEIYYDTIDAYVEISMEIIGSL